jgi:hypothetical protein
MGARTGIYATSPAMDEMLTAAERFPEVISLPEPVGDVIAHALAEISVSTVFGVISIHNMPILDAIAGPQLLEVDMTALGPFAESFAGPSAGAAGST